MQTIRPVGSDIQVLCDFSSFGGGWTLVAAQFEADPVTNWNEGRQGDYDPSLATARGFALATVDIPSHSQTAFGRVQNISGSYATAAMIDYVNFAYTTGDIALTSRTSQTNGSISYWLHRSSSAYYGCHDPDSPPVCGGLGNAPDWNNTLTFNFVQSGTYQHNWAFSPQHTNSNSRGYGYNNATLYTSSEAYAWAVWVR